MSPTFKLLAISIGFIVFFIIIRGIRNGYIREKYSFPWLIISIFFVLVPIFDVFFLDLAGFLGIYNPVNALFFFGLLFLFLWVYHFTIIISQLKADLSSIVVRIAIIDNKLPGDNNGKDDK